MKNRIFFTSFAASFCFTFSLPLVAQKIQFGGYNECASAFRESLVGKRVYYAHPLSLYDKPEELVDIAQLNLLGLRVLNPNDDKVEADFQRTQDFSIFLELAGSSDVVAVRAFPDGKLGAGVAKEALRAFEAGKPVIEIFGSDDPRYGKINYLTPEDIVSRELSIPQTIVYLDRYGVVEKIKYKKKSAA